MVDGIRTPGALPVDNNVGTGPATSSGGTNSPPIPVGNGDFSTSMSGTQPQREQDLLMAQMANDSYAVPDPATGLTGNASERELAEAGWSRVPASDDGRSLVGRDGQTIPIDPNRLNDPQTGFQAAVYQNDQGQYVVAFAGTNPKEMADIRADADQAFGVDNKQYNQAIALAKDVEALAGDGNVAYTGHSLGGGLASAASLATGGSAVTFNAAGLSDNTLRSLNLNPNQARADLAENGQIRRYVVNTDPLTVAQQDIPSLPLVGSPPNAVGHELRLALPPGVKPLIGAHGGGGDGTSYVEAMRSSDISSPRDKGLLESTLQTAGELKFNMLGTAYSVGRQFAIDAFATGQNLKSELGTTVQQTYGEGRHVAGTVQVGTTLVENGLDLVGKNADNLVTHAGQQVQSITTSTGQFLRDVGQDNWLEKPTEITATAVEKTGDFVAWAGGGIGNGLGWLGDKGGDALKWGVDKIGDGAQWATDKAVDGATWVGTKVGEGARWTGDKIADGASWVGDKVNRAMPWNW